MKNGFWGQFDKRFSCLAPMEGVTDVVFRQVVAAAGRPDVFFTEFTNVNSFASEKGRANAVERLKFLPGEMPIVAQIWGVEPAYFAVTVAGLAAMGYKAVDINMGCPEKHVVRGGGGSALIRTPELAARIIDACKGYGLAVSVKTRLGYSRVEEWREWLSFLLAQDLDALTVHLRTKKEMSKVAAHFELVPEIIALKKSLMPGTRLIINGDIADVVDGWRFVEMGADGIMIGRGVFANPFCFGGKGSRIDLLKLHLDLFDEYGGRSFEVLKRYFKVYVSGFRGAAEWREKLMGCITTDEARGIIEKLILEQEK